MDARLRRLREAEAAATAGPWWFWDTEDDANWYAEFSGEDVRQLVAERNRLLNLVDRLTAALEEMVSHHDRAMVGCPEAERARALLAEVRE